MANHLLSAQQVGAGRAGRAGRWVLLLLLGLPLHVHAAGTAAKGGVTAGTTVPAVAVSASASVTASASASVSASASASVSASAAASVPAGPRSWVVNPNVSLASAPGAANGASAAAGASATQAANAVASAQALQDAVRNAKDGDVIELLEGEYRGSLLLDNRNLTLRGVGNKPSVVRGDGKLGSNLGLWTVRGGAITLQNIEFRGARAQDGGGAGVRMEGGKLTVLRCNFFDNEHGLFAANDEAAELTIQGSVFGLAPKVRGGLYHLLNVGRIGKLNLTATRFQQGYEGHLIKSRAREAFIGYNFIHDSVRGGASYEIELANGGQAIVIGNVIGQGADNQNPVLVAYGSEGRHWDKNTLHIAHNTFINYGWLPAWFLRVFKDRLPDNTQVYAVNNLIVGPGVFWLGASGHFDGNRHVMLRMLRDAPTYGFELPPGSMWRSSGVDPRKVGGLDLSPQGEFEWPGDFRAIDPSRTSWAPGAYQR
jgi:hypothetical protein